MMTLIFANGDMDVGEWVRPFFAQASAVIAADGGARHLYALNHAPTHLIGDFDSLDAKLMNWAKTVGASLTQLPEDKDETDLELALGLAVELSDDPILIFGAFGGRVDQMMANVQLLAHLLLKERSATLVTKHEHIMLVSDQIELIGNVGDTVSLLPLDGDVTVKQTTGLKWALHNSVLTLGFARGVSNVMNEQRARIEVENGRLLCVHQYRPSNR